MMKNRINLLLWPARHYRQQFSGSQEVPAAMSLPGMKQSWVLIVRRLGADSRDLTTVQETRYWGWTVERTSTAPVDRD